MDRHGWTASAIGMLALLCALLLVAGVSLAQPLRLAEDLSLEVHAPPDAGPAQRVRGSASALFGAPDQQLFVVQLASEDARLQPALGVRWWLAQRRASFDVMARRSADGQAVEPRFGVQFVFGR